MIDLNFPYIKYPTGKSHKEWGIMHGEKFASSIRELCQIRKALMLKKNPALEPDLDRLAKAQFDVSRQFHSDYCDELLGISIGAKVSLTDIIILNNYTDFRDIELPEEGCSTAHLQRNGKISAGQTWDMHQSAKNFVCVIHLFENGKDVLLFSLVGCMGMMGINSNNNLVGVNNINTKRAKAGLIWPILVRAMLSEKDLDGMRNVLVNAPVTSGHNYLLSSPFGSEHWETSPLASEKVSELAQGNDGFIFHTNHCLGPKNSALESKESISSTTFNRFEILEKNQDTIIDLNALFKDHEGYPKSICSHYESGVQDPSMTCGGAVADYSKAKYSFWRGCPVYDTNYVEYEFILEKNHFKKVK
jgi:isopenicillin-N N-acyltransferase like protein